MALNTINPSAPGSGPINTLSSAPGHDANAHNVGMARASTATRNDVAGSASSQLMLAANTARRQSILYNDSSYDCRILLSTTTATATATVFTFILAAGQSWFDDTWNGYIYGIWSTASGAMRVTELTA